MLSGLWARRVFFRNTATFVVLRLFGQGLEFFAFVMFARQLGTANFGVLSVAYLICRYAGLVGDWGANIRGTRSVAVAASQSQVHALVRRRERVSIGLALLYSIVVVAIGFTYLAPLAIIILCRGMSRDWMSLGRERNARSAFPSVTQGLILGSCSVAVHGLTGASWSLAVAYAAALTVSILLNRLPRTTSKAKVSVDGWLMLTTLSDQVYATADVLLLAWLAGSSASGIYAAGYRIPNAWNTMLGLSVAAVLPRVIRRLRESPERALQIRRRVLHIGLGMASIVIIAMPVSWVLLPVLFGDAYTAGRDAVLILLLATAVSTSTAYLAPVYFAFSSDRTVGLFTAFTATVNVIGNIALIPVLGMAGAAFSTLVSQILLSIFLLTMTSKRNGIAPTGPVTG